MIPRAPCEICGPGPTVHTICHTNSRGGCGHLIAKHGNGGKCSVCKEQCARAADPAVLASLRSSQRQGVLL